MLGLSLACPCSATDCSLGRKFTLSNMFQHSISKYDYLLVMRLK